MADQKAVKSQTNTARVMALLHCSFVPERKVEKQETGMSRNIKPADRQDELQCCKRFISAFTLNSESPLKNSLVGQSHLCQPWLPDYSPDHIRLTAGGCTVVLQNSAGGPEDGTESLRLPPALRMSIQ